MSEQDKHVMYIETLQSEYVRISSVIDAIYTKLSIVVATALLLFFYLVPCYKDFHCVSEMKCFLLVLTSFLYGCAVVYSLSILMIGKKLNKPDVCSIEIKNTGDEVIEDLEDTYKHCIFEAELCLDERQTRCRYIYLAVLVGFLLHIFIIFFWREYCG